MTFSKSLKAVGFIVALALPSTVLAQAEPLILPDRSEVEPGDAYVGDVFRDWQVRCIRAEQDAVPDRCEMFQMLEEENGNPVAEFRIAALLRPEEDEVAAATFLTPMDTLLNRGLQLRIDDNEPAIVPYAFCRQIGCFVQLSLTPDDISMFENGVDAQVVIFALLQDASGQMGGAPVPLIASLRGFTAAFDSLEERMVEIRAFVAEQEALAEEAPVEEAPAEEDAEPAEEDAEPATE